METQSLTVIQEQDNLYKKEHTKQLPYFIVIKKANDKTIKIPCSNEEIARKLLTRFNVQSQ